MSDSEPRLALRPWEPGGDRLDDIVVREVSMFRAEMMTPQVLWMSCDLPGTGVDGDRVGFMVRVIDGELHVEADELPTGRVAYEAR